MNVFQLGGEEIDLSYVETVSKLEEIDVEDYVIVVDMDERPGEEAFGADTVLAVCDDCEEVRGLDNVIPIRKDEMWKETAKAILSALIEGDNQSSALLNLYDVMSNPARDHEEKVRAALEIGCDFFDVSNGLLTRISASTQKILYSVGIESGRECPLDRAYCKNTIESPGWYCIHSARSEGFVDDPAYNEWEFGTYIGSKLLVNEELFGTVCFADADGRDTEFTREDEVFIKIMGQLLSTELTQVENKKRLVEKAKRLEEFSHFVTHDVLNHLNAAQGFLELEEDRVGRSDNMERVQQAHRRIEEIVRDVGTLVEIEEEEFSVEDVSIREVARESWQVVGYSDEDTLHLPDEDIVLSANRGLLKQALENLFKNSVENSGAPVAVEVSGGDDGDTLFCVKDDGDGVRDDMMDGLFELTDSQKRSGGLGLPIVKRVAERHRWEVEADGKDGFEVKFKMPQRPGTSSG